MRKLLLLLLIQCCVNCYAELEWDRYYIKNADVEGTGVNVYLDAGSYWGTHAVLGHGLGFIIGEETNYSDDGEIIYALYSEIGYLWENDYLDNKKINNNYFRIKSVGDYYEISTLDGRKLSADGTFVSFQKDGKNTRWAFVTEKERLKKMKTPTNDLDRDATWLLSDPNFSRNNPGFSAWTDDYKPTKGGDNTNMNAEIWNDNTGTLEVGQGINIFHEGGWYKLSAQGFYRYNNTTENTNDVAIYTHARGGERINAYLFAKTDHSEYISRFPSIADETASTTLASLPFSQTEASAAFNQGLYRISLFFRVSDLDYVRIGVRKEPEYENGCDWTVFDNFELTYYGEEEPYELSIYPDFVADGIRYDNYSHGYCEIVGYENDIASSITLPTQVYSDVHGETLHVTSVESGAFEGCTKLTSVTFSDSYSDADFDISINTENLFKNCTSLTSVNIPNSVRWIEGGMFSGCSGLTSITIPNSVTSIKDSAFRNCI